jgi:hypothetical protein
MALRPHLVRQGEYLSELCHRRGADPEAVWNASENEALRTSRMTGEILHPGDVIWLPEPEERKLALSLESENEFTVRVPKNRLRIVMRDGDEPMANEPYVIRDAGRKPIEGTTDGQGLLRITVPFSVRMITVTMIERRQRFRIEIGHLDPIESPSGVRQRLEHLGFYGWICEPRPGDPIGQTSPEDDRRAVRAFQRGAELEPTGEVDDETRAALLDAHGS